MEWRTMKDKKGMIYILCTALAFGTMEISLKIAGATFAPFQLTFLRFLIGGLLLLPFAIKDMKKRGCKLVKSDWVYLLILGVVNICFSMILFQIGVSRSNAGIAAIVFSVNPVFTMIFSHFIVQDRFNRKKAITLLFSVIGLIVVANPASILKDGSDKAVGLLIVLVAAAGFALYTTLGKLRIQKIGGTAQNSISFLMGAAVLFVVLLVKGDPIVAGIDTHTIWPLLYVSVVVTGLGYLCYMQAIEMAGPSTASYAFFIKPIVALILSAVILSEPITVNAVIGTILIIIGCTMAEPIEKLLVKTFKK